MPLFAPLNSSAAFKSSDKMYVHASRVSTSVRAVFSHPIALSLANRALHSPSPFCLIVHPFRIHPYCIYLIRLFRVHSYRTCVVGFSARAFCAHCCMRTFATHAQSDYRSACLTSFSASIPTAPPINPSKASPNGPTRPKPCPDFAKNGRNLRL